MPDRNSSTRIISEFEPSGGFSGQTDLVAEFSPESRGLSSSTYIVAEFIPPQEHSRGGSSQIILEYSALPVVDFSSSMLLIEWIPPQSEIKQGLVGEFQRSLIGSFSKAKRK